MPSRRLPRKSKPSVIAAIAAPLIAQCKGIRSWRRRVINRLYITRRIVLSSAATREELHSGVRIPAEPREIPDLTLPGV